MKIFKASQVMSLILVIFSTSMMGNQINEKKLRVGYWTTWDIKCGIAVYTKNLVDSFRRAGHSIFIYRHDMPLNQLKKAIAQDKIDVLNVQFEPGIMPTMKKFLDVLKSVRKSGTKVVITVHLDMPELQKTVSLVNHFIYHKQPAFVNAPHKITIIHHGVPVFDPEITKKEMRAKYGFAEDDCIVTTTGFLDSWKEFDSILELLIPWLQSNPKNKVQLLTAYYSHAHDLSAREDIKVKNIIKHYGMEKQIIHETKFISQQELSERLWMSDLGYLWGCRESKSSSGVGPQFIASRLPSVCTNLSHFHNLTVGTLKTAQDKNLFISTIIKLARDKVALQLMNSELEQHYKNLNYDALIEKHREVFSR